MLLEVRREHVADDRLDDALRLAVAELVLRLPFELRLGHLQRQDGGQALAEVVARGQLLAVLHDLLLLGVVVQRARQRRLEPGQVRAPALRVDVVDEGEDDFLVRIRVLQRELDLVLAVGPLRAGHGSDQVHHVRVDRRLVLVDVLDERHEALGILEVLARARALVLQIDRDAASAHQVGHLAQALGDDLVLDLGRAEDLRVGLERHRRARRAALPDDLERRRAHAALERHAVRLALAVDDDLQPLGQRVDARHADAVQAAGHLVRALVELAAGVQLGQRDLDRRDAFRLVEVDRDAASVVPDADRAVGVDRDPAVPRVPGQRLVHRVVDNLPDEVVEAAHVGVADVHRRTHAHRLEAFEDGDRLSVVGVAAGLLVVCHGCCGSDHAGGSG
jgi:hypothetical protein